MRWLQLIFLRWRARMVADDLMWIRENIRYGQVRERELESNAYALQAKLWALERPGKLIREAI